MDCREIQELLDGYYQAGIRICGKEIDQSKAIAKIHRLATHNFQEVPHFPKVVQVNIASAILNDLEESRLELLRVLQRLCSRREEDRCKTPGLWLKALEAARDEKRKLEFKAGFLSSLQKCASVGKDVEQASKDVTCVPCCAVAGCLAILSAILELELTSKAFACDMMPEDLKDNV
eukprot:symbB.v1.2.028871.t1/scaffold3100.1/size63577/2